MPSAVPRHQLLRSFRTPRPLVIWLDRWGCIQKRPHDSPRLLHAVLAGEESGVALEGITEEPLVKARAHLRVLRKAAVSVPFYSRRQFRLRG